MNIEGLISTARMNEEMVSFQLSRNKEILNSLVTQELKPLAKSDKVEKEKYGSTERLSDLLEGTYNLLKENEVVFSKIEEILLNNNLVEGVALSSKVDR